MVSIAEKIGCVPLSSPTVPSKNAFIELLAKDASAADYHVTPETTGLGQENNPPAAKEGSMVCAHIDFVRDRSLLNNATAAECGNSHRRYELKRSRNLCGPSLRAQIDRAWRILSIEQTKPTIPAAKVSQSEFSL